MTPPTNKALLRNMELLHEAAGRGDPAAITTLKSLQAKADAGDLGALAAINTYTCVGYEKAMPAEWNEAAVMHGRLASGDPEAEKWLNAVKHSASSATSGVSEKATTTLNMLAAHNDKHYASAWAQPDDGEAEDENTRTRNVTPMSLSRRHARRRAYAIGNMVIGADPTPTPHKKFLPLTPQAEQQLIKMMLLGATAHAAPNSMAAAALANVTPLAPSEPSICAQARAAIARQSPMAYALVQQCNAAAGRQVLAPVAPPTAGPTSDGIAFGKTVPTMHLGRTGTSTMSSATMGLQGICSQAASAKARNSPIYPQLLQKCMATRAANIQNGLFIADDLAPNMIPQDPASVSLRVALTNAGNAVVAKNPKMAAFRATLPDADQQRGFTMAMAARAGQVDPKFIAFLTPGLAGSPTLLKGFLDGMNM